MPENIVLNGEVVAWDALSDFLAEILKTNRFSAKQVALVIPDSLTFTR